MGGFAHAAILSPYLKNIAEFILEWKKDYDKTMENPRKEYNPKTKKFQLVKPK